MSKIDLMLAVNDHRNGLHTGRVEMMEIDDVIKLEGRPIVCNVDGRKLKLGRLRISLLGYGTWVGNWCWDCARIESADAARAVNYLRKRGWNCFEAEAALYEKYHGDEEITAEDLEFEE